MTWTQGQPSRTNQSPFTEPTPEDNVAGQPPVSRTYARANDRRPDYRQRQSTPNRQNYRQQEVAATFTQEGLQTFSSIFASSVEAAIAKSLPDIVDRALERTAERTIERTVERTIERNVAQAIERTVERTALQAIERLVKERLEQNLADVLRDTVRDTLFTTVNQTIDRSVRESIERVMQEAVIDATVAHVDDTEAEADPMEPLHATESLDDSHLVDTPEAFQAPEAICAPEAFHAAKPLTEAESLDDVASPDVVKVYDEMAQVQADDATRSLYENEAPADSPDHDLDQPDDEYSTEQLEFRSRRRRNRASDETGIVIETLRNLGRPVRTSELPSLIQEVHWGSNPSAKITNFMNRSEGYIQRIGRGMYAYHDAPTS